MRPSVLIVDDEKLTCESLGKYLSDDYSIHIAHNGQEALEKLKKNDGIEIVLSDVKMPKMGGIELLDNIHSNNPDVVVVFMTAFSTIETAVEAMKKGAYDYLTKPLDLTKLDITIKNAIENKKLRSENIRLKQKIKEKVDTTILIGNSRKMKEIIDLVKRVSSTKANVLIQGSSGTGKEVVANIIHYNSPVADGPFIKVNCSALAEGVLESELFGHEKGSFTGALYMKKGRFELADGGTLFLDEIGDLPPSIQVKLLRFLQESAFERVGGTKTIKVDVRIISATNKNLDELVKEEKFREDLFYRLKVVTIDVPPLKERKEDIQPIVEYYLEKFSNIHNKNVKRITGKAMKIIESFDWPGNIRELVNCIESVIVMSSKDYIDVMNLPSYLLRSNKKDMGASTSRVTLSEMEKGAIVDTLQSVGGNKAKTARILGIGLRTLYRKLEQYGIDET
jgi:DNA-binding NtrC family response regulator